MLERPRNATRKAENVLITPADRERFKLIAEKLGSNRHAILRRLLSDLFEQHPEIVASVPSEETAA